MVHAVGEEEGEVVAAEVEEEAFEAEIGDCGEEVQSYEAA